ncbi:beta-glucosidase [Penicillium canescens]|uniref:beta-glucosidase n=1 Tax=Penicillium canescens TaxID=5083 RepID=UPI0026E0256E|nr:beta-glucosidase [Penicillium canescens]KAJ6050602.1 beta-glucosidase [Penicillium canescens]
MPDSMYWAPGLLAAGLSNGSLSLTRLDDIATRILAAWYNYAELEHPESGMPVNLLEPYQSIEARDPASKKTRFQSAVEGHVLVKKSGAVLLSKPKFVSLFGYDLTGLDNSLAVSLATGAPGWPGTLFSGGGSCSNTPSYIDAPFDAFQRQTRRDGTFLAWDLASAAPHVNPASEVCGVFVNEQSSEGWDRSSQGDAYSDQLIQNVADQCNNAMVVIRNAVLLTAGGSPPPGTPVSPSGRPPCTVAVKETDYGLLLHPAVHVGEKNAYYPQADFSEGILIHYKAFEAADFTPRYEFGYGLTYTTFDYFNQRVTAQEGPPGISRS